ncbi:MAG: argininosuccinate synthase [bacterium]|nr:argininosuccinate synthase [bacterium]
MKVVLAYSGGLDTSVIIKWLIENYQAEVIAFSADLGQGENIEPLRKKAMETGASRIYISDLKEEFVTDYIFPALKAGAIYESKYLLATALSRPLIAKHLIEVAKAEQADAIAHGCTGKGNDQVRFELAVAALAPRLRVIAPVREWELGSREAEIEYAQKHQIPIPVTKENPYSIDRNLWGVSIECGILENPWEEPPADAYQITTSPIDAPSQPIYLEVEFEEGLPVKLNGKSFSPVDLINELNWMGGEHGIGRVDMVENRLVGIKSREIYESPAGTILYLAHRELETMVLDRETGQFKELISRQYARLIYDGLWFSQLREALDGFVNKTQTRVTGQVRLKLYKGNASVVGRQSPYSLYRYDLATYEEGDLFDHRSAEGFIRLFGLPLRIAGELG